MRDTSGFFGLGFFCLFWLVPIGEAAAECVDTDPIMRPGAHICIDTTCEKVQVKRECNDRHFWKATYDNGLNYICPVGGSRPIDCYLSSRKYDKLIKPNRVTCSNRTLSEACYDLDTPCDQHMDVIRQSFDAMPFEMRVSAQEILDILYEWATRDPNDLSQHDPAYSQMKIDGIWGPQTAKAMVSFCRYYLLDGDFGPAKPLSQADAFQIPPRVAVFQVNE